MSLRALTALVVLAAVGAAATLACTNDYGALRFPLVTGDGGAEGGGTPDGAGATDGG